MKKPQGEAFQPPAPREDVRVGANRCPFCRDDVLPEQSVVCRDCLTRHHRPCWDEGSGCSSCRGTNLLEPARAPQPELQQPAWQRQDDGSFVFAVPFEGEVLRVTANPFFTRLSLEAGETHLTSVTRSLLTVLLQGFQTWFGASPTWEFEADCEIKGVERRVKAVHRVTFTKHLMEIYVDGEPLGGQP